MAAAPDPLAPATVKERFLDNSKPYYPLTSFMMDRALRATGQEPEAEAPPATPSSLGGVREAVMNAMQPAAEFASGLRGAVAAGADPDVMPKGVTSTGHRYRNYDPMGRASGQIYKSVDAAHGGIPAYGDNQFDLALNSGVKLSPEEAQGYERSAGIRGQQIADTRTSRMMEDRALALRAAQQPQNAVELADAVLKERQGKALLENALTSRMQGEANARLTGSKADLLSPEERSREAYLLAHPGDFAGAYQEQLKMRAASGLAPDQGGNVAEQNTREDISGATQNLWGRLTGKTLLPEQVNLDPNSPDAAHLVSAPWKWLVGAAPSGQAIEYTAPGGGRANVGLDEATAARLRPTLGATGIRAVIQKNLRPVTSAAEEKERAQRRK